MLFRSGTLVVKPFVAVAVPGEPVAGPEALGAPTFTLPEGSAGASVTFDTQENPTTDEPSGTPFAAGAGAVFVDIRIDGAATGPFVICLDGEDPDVLWHFEDGEWKDVTYQDARAYGTPGKVCGETMSLSPFASAPSKPRVDVALTVSPSVAVVGDEVTFGATVTPKHANDAVPTGTVDFIDGNDLLASCTLTAGSCSVTTDAVDPGVYTVTAGYAGDEVFRAGTSAATSPLTVKAKFTLTVTPTLLGTATGTVSADSGLVDCGLVCSDRYVDGTVVTLTATPGADAELQGWGGACGSATGETCTVTMSQARTVTATFGDTIVPTLDAFVAPAGPTDADVLVYALAFSEPVSGLVKGEIGRAHV